MLDFRNRTAFVAAAAACVLVAAAPAAAGLIPEVEVSIVASDGTDTTFNPTGVGVGGDIYNYAGAGTFDGFTIDWDFNADDSPGGADLGAFVGGNFDITNTTDATLSMTLSILLPLSSGGAGLTYNGSAGYTLTGIDGLLESQAGSPLWEATADGGGVDSLFDDPFSDGFAGTGTASDSTSLTEGTTDAFDSIGVILSFELSPEDTVTFTSVFAVVPAPPALALLAVAGLAGRRRRR